MTGGEINPLCFLLNLNVDLTAPRDVTCSPRVYDENDDVVNDPATGMPYTSGFVPGLYMGIDVAEVADASRSLPSFVKIQRREFLREDGTEPDTTPVDLPRRIRINQAGNLSAGS